jgi:hypothetical protein
MKLQFSVAALCLAAIGAAQQYNFRVVAHDLQRPIGITATGAGNHLNVYFTQVPTPGVMGGANTVDVLDVKRGTITNLHMGDPEPLHLAFGRSGLHWTCRSAGVILRLTSPGNATPVLTGLARPTGIAFGQRGLYFTQVPEPGVPMGTNQVNLWDGSTIHVLSMGEPEPTDVAVTGDGTAYWTCTSAGVILKRTASGQKSLFLSGLNKPMGIAVNHASTKLYFTEVPEPGVPMGANKVWEVDLRSGQRRVVHSGDPEPTDVTVAQDGRIYWTCTSAGVIVEASLRHR